MEWDRGEKVTSEKRKNERGGGREGWRRQSLLHPHHPAPPAADSARFGNGPGSDRPVPAVSSPLVARPAATLLPHPPRVPRHTGPGSGPARAG